MAQLKSSVVQGSLRVTDTTYTTDLNLSSATASRLLGTDTNKNIISMDMTVSAPSASGNATAFITSVSQSADGKISASKATVPNASTSTAGIMKVGTGLGVSSGTVSVSYGSTASTAVQGNQTIFTLNGSAVNSGSGASFYAPTGAGTANQILVSTGGAPTWKATANGAAYATSNNGALTFGLLPVAQGGTGINTADPHKVLIGPSSDTAAAPTWRQILNNEIAPIDSKIYTAKVYGADGSGTCYHQNFMMVTPADYNAIWTVTYRVIVTAEGYPNYTAVYDEKISGRSNTYYSWYSYNSLVNYPIYAHMLLNSNSAGTPHEIGIRMASSYGDTTVVKKIQVDLLETYNCSVELLDDLKYYTSATPSGYTWRSWNSTSNGMQESGDNDSNGYYILSNGFKGQAGSNKVYRYCLFARTGDGTYESFVMESNTRTTTKTPNTHGFVPDGKIYWNSSGTDYSAGTLNITPYEQYHALDYLYSFNFDNTFLSDYCETYVVYTYDQNTGLLYLDTTQWLAAALPTTEDGKIYQRIGSKYYTGTGNYYQASLLLDNPYYEYKNGQIQAWHPIKTIADISATLNPIGVTSTDTSILKRDTLITMTGGAISAASLNLTNNLIVANVTTLNGSIIGKSEFNYGAALPSSGTTGQLFFQTSALQYELPEGGAAGTFLIKDSAEDRDVIWGNTVSSLTATGNITSNSNIVATGTISGSQVFNAVWNDYAECRNSSENQAGRVVTETYSGQMERANQRLMPGCKVISDTYGTLMGESDIAKTPIAIAGRVLVYPYKNREQYQLGDAVCSAPNGTVDIMSREEISQYPERIVGTVSEIPTYEQWRAGTEENPQYIDVNGRIWIYVR